MAEDKYVKETLQTFEEHLAENQVDFGKTNFYLGSELTIDPKTERSTNEEANRLFTREYRQGFVLPEVG
jgi:hypothetical protein